MADKKAREASKTGGARKGQKDKAAKASGDGMQQTGQSTAAPQSGNPKSAGSKSASASVSKNEAGAGVAIGAKKTAGASGISVGRPSPAGAKPTVSHMLGEVTWLLSQSATHKHFAIGDLEWLVMPAILLEQFRVFHGEKHPLGFALWAEFSQEAEKRFLEQVESGRGARLRPQDWKSGDRLWLIEIVAPLATPDNKLNEAMLADLIDNVFKTRPFKLHVIDPTTGKREMKEVGA